MCAMILLEFGDIEITYLLRYLLTYLLTYLLASKVLHHSHVMVFYDFDFIVKNITFNKWQSTKSFSAIYAWRLNNYLRMN